MNIKLLVLVVVLVCSLGVRCVNAQGGRLKNSRFFQIGAGFSGAGPLLSGYGGLAFDPKIKGLFGGGIGIGNDADINYTYTFLDGMGSFNLYSANRFFYFNGLAGVSFAGDFINKFPNDKNTNQFSFNYGVIGGCEAEFYASRNLIFVITGTQRYYVRNEFGNWRYQATVSLRIIL